MNRFARRTGSADAVESIIVRELQDRGAIVVIVDRPLDLLVGYRGRWTFCEVKTGPGATIRKSQQDFLARCRMHDLPAVILDDLDDVDVFFPVQTESTP